MTHPVTLSLPFPAYSEGVRGYETPASTPPSGKAFR